jgi:hypothetical protein
VEDELWRRPSLKVSGKSDQLHRAAAVIGDVEVDGVAELVEHAALAI